MDQFDVEAVVPADPRANTTQLLLDRVEKTPNLALFATPTDDGGWEDVTASEFLNQVRALAKGLIASGIEPGDKIGIICSTRYEWSLIDFATWFAGAVLVPVYETSSPEQMQWSMTDSGARAMIVETADHFARFDEVHAELSNIDLVWQLHLGDVDKLMAAGTEVSDDEVERRRSLATGDDLATLIYTAGTTGKPKGCVITHSNFVELSRNSAIALSPVVLEEGCSTLLFITIAHVFARFISILCVHAGVRVGHQADTKQLLPALASFRPSFLLAVPRVFEKVYNSAEQKAESGGKGAIFQAAVKTAVAHSKAVMEGSVPFGLKMKYSLYNALVYKKLRAAMGGNVKYAVSGSAPLGERLGHFFHSLGIVILEGYGLTETTAPATVNLVDNFKIGTVGPPLPGVSVRISDENEVWVKGNNIFREYWNNPSATEETFDGDWFKTGDLGSLDDEGFLTITGRKKEMLITAGGKNVAPATLEDAIRAHPLVGQVVVVGDQRPFIAALVTLDSEMLPTWLENNKFDASMTLAQASRHEEVRAEVQRAVDHANAQVSRAESVRKFTILPSEWTEESGHLTPKLSIKRHEILHDFAAEVEALYSQAPLTEGHSLSH